VSLLDVVTQQLVTVGNVLLLIANVLVVVVENVVLLDAIIPLALVACVALNERTLRWVAVTALVVRVLLMVYQPGII
jgi:hypothetical protein